MKEDIEILHSVSYDFVLSLSRLNHNESLSNFIKTYDEELSDKIKLNEGIVKWVKSVLGKISEEKKHLIDVYGNKDTCFRIILLYYIRIYQLNSVQQLIDFIKQKEAQQILEDYFRLLFSYLKNPKTGNEIVEILKNNKNELMDFINSTDLLANRKWELLQFASNPDEMKSNLVMLFEWYYVEIFKKEEVKIEKIIGKYEKDLKRKLHNYGYEYLTLLTSSDYSKPVNDRKVVLILSYYLEVIYLLLFRYDKKEDLYFLGYRHNEVFVERKHRIMSNVHLFKALADETRQNIIRLLTKRDYYGEEFAQEMQLSNSTISHHLSILLLEGFIKVKRTVNRNYFTLDKKKLQKTILDAVDRMLVK